MWPSRTEQTTPDDRSPASTAAGSRPPNGTATTWLRFSGGRAGGGTPVCLSATVFREAFRR